MQSWVTGHAEQLEILVHSLWYGVKNVVYKYAKRPLVFYISTILICRMGEALPLLAIRNCLLGSMLHNNHRVRP